MNLDREPKTRHSLHICCGKVHHLDGIEPGMTVTCDQGIVWLTESNDRQDYMLKPGHSMVIRQRGEVVIEALRDATLSIIYPN
ncbi:MAG: DUF2917 domain-containing protein [Chloroflexota bacterium]